ncbi:MAG TPA: SDR family NAD(P)-dependent oxidoreductase [Mycobacterium sp.]|nr:SDR family NAD(P)-dependent oxidoreductase [Mycobacterium sp.]
MILRRPAYRNTCGQRATAACGEPVRMRAPKQTADKEIDIMATISGTAVLITGGNRGIGSALALEALNRGARRVYVGTRNALTDDIDSRVTPVALDITNASQIRAAVEKVDSLDILINNAGLALYDDLNDRSVLEQHLAVNLFGTYDLVQAFLPLLAQSRGSIVNNLSVNALAPLSLIPAYSVSKAAAFSLTQSLRVILAAQGVRVHAVLTGPVDTDMTRALDIPKASPQSVAKGIFDGVEDGDDEIFPDPMSRSLTERWYEGAAKLLEQQYAALLAQNGHRRAC